MLGLRMAGCLVAPDHRLLGAGLAGRGRGLGRSGPGGFFVLRGPVLDGLSKRSVEHLMRSLGVGSRRRGAHRWRWFRHG